MDKFIAKFHGRSTSVLLRYHVIWTAIIFVVLLFIIFDKIKNLILFNIPTFIPYQTLLSIKYLLNISTGLITPFGVHTTLGPHKVCRSIYGRSLVNYWTLMTDLLNSILLAILRLNITRNCVLLFLVWLVSTIQFLLFKMHFVLFGS